MERKEKQVSLGRAIICVVLCVAFAALTTYQFCFYTLYADYRDRLAEEAESHALLLASRDAQIATLQSSLSTCELERAALGEQVEALRTRLLSLTGKEDGTAEDCLRMLLTAALEKEDAATGATAPAGREAEVARYMQTYAADFINVAERLLFIDYLYRIHYIGKAPDPDAMQEAVIEGYIAAAGDLYAAYYTPAEYQDYVDRMNATIRCGIGAVTTRDATGTAILVLHVHRNSPAALAGLQAGDRLVAVDGQFVAEIGYDAALALIAGEAETSVSLTVARGEEERLLSVARRAVEADAVIARVEEENGKKIGYLRLVHFNNRLAPQLKQAYATLLESGVEALVFDVRDNSGGSLSAVLAVLDFLLPAGKKIVTLQPGNHYNTREPYYTTDAQEVTLPITVLQNRNTASAAELFAATLSYYGRATLIGERSYGKGTVQTGHRLADGSYITVTVANYLPPDGVSYAGVGITPDIAVPLATADQTLSIYLLPKERDLPLQRALSLLTAETDQ